MGGTMHSLLCPIPLFPNTHAPVRKSSAVAVAIAGDLVPMLNSSETRTQ